jgi:hypothetical protein
MRHIITGPALVLAAAMLLSAPAQSPAQQRQPGATADARLGARLDARTRAEVVRVIDSVGRLGLPAEPLVDKALEGASKRADGARIVAAVRRLAGALGTARAALGERASEGELVAGASALHGGVSVAAISQLREERPGQSLTVPLAVLSELIARGVSADTATRTVLALTELRATDEQLVAFRRDVERDIGAGAPPSTAAIGRSLAAGEALASAPANVGNSLMDGRNLGITQESQSNSKGPRKRP